jgi:DNA mismatch repair protein MutL
MPKIKQLSLHEAHKIAAGEVVERPAHIVKELIENSIDAGASVITIHLADGGKQLIRIIDNGCGMDAEDAHLCFAKHATSKIESIDELERINTFGFRGEALASIAAVSNVTLVTKEAEALEGIKVTVAHSAIQASEAVAATTGTDITITHLFDTIPARKKFLKTRETEVRAIVQIIQAFCLDYTAIHFKLFSDGIEILNCPPVEALKHRFAQLWNISNVLTLAGENKKGTIALSGLIAQPTHYRYDRSALFFMINKRWVKDSKLTNALLKGFKKLLPEGRYPFACLILEIDPLSVDINIHPRKEEVRFLNPRIVEQSISDALTRALEHHTTSHLQSTTEAKSSFAPFAPHSTRPLLPKDFQPIKVSSPSNSDTAFDYRRSQSHSFFTPTPSSFSIPEQAPSVIHLKQQSAAFQTPISALAPTIQVEESCESYGTIIGQYHKTYILLAQDEGLYMIDQHAAHERILYEIFADRFKKIESITLLFPHIITLNTHDIALISEQMPLLHDNGIQCELFGPQQLIIHATPIHIKNINIEELIREIIGTVIENKNLSPADLHQKLTEHLHAQMACKAAVKAGDELSMEQMQQIIRDLATSNNRFACPHGRPTGWLMALSEIEKRFKRRS